MMIDDTSSVTPPPRSRGRGGRLRRAYEWFVFWTLVLAFGAASLAWSQIAAVLVHLLPRRLGLRLGQAAITAGFRSLVAMMRLSGIIACDLRALEPCAINPAS